MSRRLEDGLLVFLLGGLILLPVSQVVLRNLGLGGFYWGDSAVRIIVLWVAMLGALIASREDNHIRIDLLSRFLSSFSSGLSVTTLQRMNYLFTCFILAMFAYASFQFVYYEYVDGAIAFGLVPAWICELIIPLASGLMAMRYFAYSFRGLPQ